MWMVRRADRLAGGVAVAVTATAVFGLVAGGGCEAIVGDQIPSFTCVPGVAQNCPTGSVCVPSTRQCVARSETCTPGASTGCAAGSRCDPQTLRCTQSSQTDSGDGPGADATSVRVGDSATDSPGVVATDGPLLADAPSGDAADSNAGDVSTGDGPPTCRGITCSCSRPSDCDSGICADQLTATTALSMAIMGMNFCTQPCCTSFDCPLTTVCFGTGGGGSYCVAPGWIGRGSTLGGVEGGAMCTGNSECRSGVCSNGACADTCCSTAQESTECAGSTVCRFAAFPGSGFDTHETAWCGAAVGNVTGGGTCVVGDSSCQSGKCSFTHCVAACRISTDCSSGLECSYGAGPTTVPSNKDIVAGCLSAAGITANGGTCTSNADCQSAFCDGSHCTDACATDMDCKSGLHCRPVIVQVQGSYAVLACES